jgi:hypothetical protein
MITEEEHDMLVERRKSTSKPIINPDGRKYEDVYSIPDKMLQTVD